MTPPLLLGVDLGTRAARATLYASDGTPHGSGAAEYDYTLPQPGWAEQNTAEVWEAFVSAVRRALAAGGPTAASRVKSLVISGTAVTLLTCDAEGEPLAPALLWMDTRAFREADEMTALASPWQQYTGGHISPEWMLPKAIWLKRHAADLYQRTAWLCEQTDWITHRLTGVRAHSLCTASAEWCYASPLGGWPLELFETLGLADLPQRLAPLILPPGAVVGPLRPEAAASLGLPPEVLVGQGLMDSYAAALGLDVLAPGRVSISLGTSSAYLALAAAPHFDPALLGPVPDAFGLGTWALQGGQTSAAALVGWFAEQLAADASFAELDAAAAAIQPGANGLMALDCWQGSRTPHRDPLARGAFWGLHLGHTRAHLYRALLEAIAYGGRQVLERLAGAGADVTEPWICGGGTRSRLLLQIHADVFGRRLVLPQQTEAATLGSALCAAVAAGLWPDLRTAGQQMVQAGERIEPDLSAHSRYNALYAEYQGGYPMLRDSLHRLARSTQAAPTS
ncbi:MAG: hypothetical protein IT317_09705 [Anaerolineales bacterium]|nr:hypothetical protein [Anaerolineales bacterium]